MAKFINLTPHALALNSGEVIPASGNVARLIVQCIMDAFYVPICAEEKISF